MPVQKPYDKTLEDKQKLSFLLFPGKEFSYIALKRINELFSLRQMSLMSPRCLRGGRAVIVLKLQVPLSHSHLFFCFYEFNMRFVRYFYSAFYCSLKYSPLTFSCLLYCAFFSFKKLSMVANPFTVYFSSSPG